jgi:uncharacterized protein (DUF1800 family)
MSLFLVRLKTLPAAAVLTAAGAIAVLGSAPRAASPANDEKTVVHVLNRIGFGARPGDVERVQKIGLQKYIEQQLHPETIPDSGMAARLADLKTVNLSSREIAEDYARPMLEARRDRKQQQAKQDPQEMTERPRPGPGSVQQKANSVVVELAEQKILRAVYSNRQLEEVLTDFWFNHFNVDARKGQVRFLLTEYEREAIRPHVLGNFRDLLEATAKSPAMLFYLDNWMSADPNGPHPDAGADRARSGRPGRAGRGRLLAMPQRPAQAKRAPKGLNENYGRELMELHTLGVEGGYTQKDVTEVARAFTGWTIENPRNGGGFRFEPRIHDNAEKIVLGHTIKAGGGIQDGEQVLDILAKHPSTARFIATKLARRFVSDTPPPALVDRLAERFTQTHGDLRAVTATLLASPEFLAPETLRAKVKTPFEFVVSAVRATGAEIADARPLIKSLQELGMPLYQCQPPTGYKDTADGWTNTGALVNRMNFALALSRRPANVMSASALDEVLAHDLSETTRNTIAKASSPAQALALTLGSPEFQRR